MSALLPATLSGVSSPKEFEHGRMVRLAFIDNVYLRSFNWACLDLKA